MSRVAAISVFILDVTATLAALFGLLTAVSGLCLTKPEVVAEATMGVFSSYAICSKLHLGWVSITAIVLSVIHGAAGFYIWLLRTGRDWPWIWALGLVLSIWFIYVYAA